MPGLVGLTSLTLSSDVMELAVSKMRDLLLHEKFHKSDPNFSKTYFCAGRVHTGIIQTAEQPDSSDGVHVWLDGEFYNQPELRSNLATQDATCTDASLLRQLYTAYPDLSFLKNIDGIYSAAIFDSKRGLVHLLIDRYGLRHLYWCRALQGLAWASEVKAFLAVPGFEPKIDPESVTDFLSMGYLLDERTWFRDAKLLAPGTVLTFDLKAQAIRTSSYWSWSDIKPLSERIDHREVIVELNRLFVDVVQRHSRADAPVGISLSGGLDSRALLAAISVVANHPIHAVTFGVSGCEDIRIAAEVARAKPAIHHIVDLTSANWLCKRFAGVWSTDGQANILHMHALISMEEQRKHYLINLNGFWGDALLGGLYVNINPQWSTPQKFSNRGRRFINEGTRLANNFIHNRLPFCDKRLAELAYSIPPSLTADSALYNKLLLYAFPSFFRSIPWQKTGLPITSSRARVFATKKLRGAMRRVAEIVPRSAPSKHNCHDYATWIRQAPARPLFERLLLNPAPLFREFVRESDVPRLWSEHMRGRDNSEDLCRALTFELWLQQVNDRHFRQASLEVDLALGATKLD